MQFIKTCCFIILLYAVLGHAAQASSSAILKDAIPIEQLSVHDKPKTKERKKVVIVISKGAEIVIVTIVEIIIDVCVNAAGCSSSHNYNYR